MGGYNPQKIDELRDTLLDRMDATPFMTWPADLLTDLITLFDTWMPTLRANDGWVAKPRLHLVR